MQNQPVHLTPKACAFFSLAISQQNVAFAKSSLAFGAGDSHVILSLAAGKVRIVRSMKDILKKVVGYFAIRTGTINILCDGDACVIAGSHKALNTYIGGIGVKAS